MATKKKPARMTGAQYQAAIDALGLNQLQAARFLKIGDRTSRRYAAGETIPHGIALLLRVMIDRSITPAELGYQV